MSEKDRLLRAAVFAAFAARSSKDFLPACQRVVDVHTLWPLIQYEQSLEMARRARVESEARVVAYVELLRSTYPHNGEAGQ